jgi:hypothetical protein
VKSLKSPALIAIIVVVLGFKLSDAAITPTTSSIAPSQGTTNTSVTLYGTNLSGTTSIQFLNSSSQVVGSLNNSAAISSVNTSVTFTISPVFEAMLGPGTYQIEAVTSAGRSNGQSFTMTAPATTIASTPQPPAISSLGQASVQVGGTVVVYGMNFTNQTFVGIDGANGISIQPALIDLISSSELSFVLPASVGVGTHTLGVAEVAGPWSLSSPVSFAVTTIAPNPPPITISTPVAGSESGAASTRALQQQLTQLLTLLLQLLDQAAAKGLLTSGQLKSALGAISQ